MRPIHPFPARMAHELAMSSLEDLAAGSTVLDPMAGSGTVIRHALSLKHKAIGIDMDPLAVLMAKVSTTPYDTKKFLDFVENVLEQASRLSSDTLCLDWIDNDIETKKFVEFWFAEQQRNDIRRLAYLIACNRNSRKEAELWNALKISLSRTIVSKEQKASLARDTSHSRPHRVTLTNDYDVFNGVRKSAQQLAKILLPQPGNGNAIVNLGDARKLKSVKPGSVDAVVTSPPYLNAIDYLRGHKMALVWFGYRIKDIRQIRGDSIGAEKSLEIEPSETVKRIAAATGRFDAHPDRIQKMIYRYANDLFQQLGETARVLKQNAKAIYVVGNSCLRNIYVENSEAVLQAAIASGLRLISRNEREIPPENRYLPINAADANALGKRMRTEVVLTFEK